MTTAAGIQDTLRTALTHHQAGRLDEAERLYRQVLEAESGHPDALHLLGRIAHARGDAQTALALIQRAIAAKPTAAAFYNSLGMILGQSGQPAAAAQAFQRAVALNPRDMEAVRNLGTALLQQAPKPTPPALVENPSSVGGQSPEAMARALCLSARQLARRGQPDEARTAWQAAARLCPRDVRLLRELGACLLRQRRWHEAAAVYQQALRLAPQAPDLCLHLSIVLGRLGQWPQALALGQQAVERKPNWAEAHLHLGHLLSQFRRFDEAVASHQQALALRPRFAPAYHSLASLLAEQRRLPEALVAARQAVALRPRSAEAHCNLGNLFKRQGQLTEAIACYRQAIEFDRAAAPAHSNLLFAMNYHSGFDAASRWAEAQEWARRHAAAVPLCPPPPCERYDPDRRLRIGYVSPSFRDHATAFFLEPVLAHHDHQTFHVTCYSDVRRGDRATERFRGYADTWCPVLGRTDEEVTQRVGQDQIDLLVDLSGHTGDHRLRVFARKPAPVQVSYLEYPPTTGLRTIDYKLTDAWADPTGAAEPFYSEALWRLEPCAWCYRPGDCAPEVGPPPFRAAGHVTFGALGNFAKVTPAMLRRWAMIVAAVPASRLLLLWEGGELVHRQVLAEFASHGVNAERLELVPRRPRAEYLRCYQQVDIALDTFPYHGHTTTCDALWMGVPVVTLIGPTHVSRVGLSLLSNLGLADLSADAQDAYVQRAVALAGDPERLARLRSELRPRMERSPLRDEVGFTRKLEAAYRAMWQRACAGAGRRV